MQSFSSGGKSSDSSQAPIGSAGEEAAQLPLQISQPVRVGHEGIVPCGGSGFAECGRALALLLKLAPVQPLRARVASDNVGSLGR